MTVHQLSRTDARRVALRAQLLDGSRPGDLLDTVRRLTLLQLDPTAAVARNADLVVFVGGLGPAREAVSVRRTGGAELLVTDGPYLETKEHIGGFWVLETTTLDEAVEWGRKAALACRAPVEVRAFN